MTVASEAAPERVIDLLKKAATDHPKVAKELPAQVLLTNVADGSASFELRAWANQSEDWQQVRSDLFISLRALLAKEKIAMH